MIDLQEILFWLLFLLVLQPFRLRLALVAFLAISHVDMSGPMFDSAARIGWENSLKSLVLPAWMVLRGWNALALTGRSPSRVVFWALNRPLSIAWALLVAYAALAASWSPYPVAAIKLVAALASHSMVFAALFFFWLTSHLNRRVILASMLTFLALGAIQTFVLGNTYAIGEEIVFFRFTSFSGPQSFAQSFVALGAILVWAPRWGALARLASTGLLVVGPALAGSRIGFAGALAAVGVWWLRRIDRRRILFLAAFLIAAGLAMVPGSVREKVGTSRLAEVGRLFEERGSIEDVGTFRWRRSMYTCYWDELAKRPAHRTLFGSGTSSTGAAALLCYPRYDPGSFSPNRVAHCEPLRAFYEWGLIGLLLFALLAAGLAVGTVRGFFRAETGNWDETWHFGPLASVAPLLALTLAFESLLQGAFSPGAVGFILVIAQRAAAGLTWSLSGEKRQL